MYIDTITKGIRLANKNWKLLLVQFVLMISTCAGFVLLIGIPLAVAFVFFGVDLVAAKNILQMLNDPMNIVSKYLGLVIFILSFVLLYITLVSIIGIFTLGGTIGVLRNSINDNVYTFSVASFIKEGKRLFVPLMWLTLIIGIILISVFFVFGVIGGGAISATSYLKGRSTPIALFIGTFLSILVIILGAVSFLAVFAFSIFSIVILAVEESKPIAAIKKTYRFLSATTKAFVFYLILFCCYIAAAVVVLLIGYPFSLIPIVGPLLNLPYQIISYVIYSYLNLVLFASMAVFYLENRGSTCPQAEGLTHEVPVSG